MKFIRYLSVFPIILALAISAGCDKLAYYQQSVGGQFDVWQKRRDIADVMADASIPSEIKHKLEMVLKARNFANDQLGLPDNDSYRSYADLRRSHVVWNVVATPEFSTKPETWCFLFAGCVSYRGYFDKDKAEAFSIKLQHKSLDTYVYGVSAYSTLGWFDDPVLNTFINREPVNIAALIFHELAHQQVYVKGDTTFNESFATVVEQVGTQRWLDATGEGSAINGYRLQKKRHQAFVDLVLSYRPRLQQLYQSALTSDDKRKQKQVILSELRKDYLLLKTKWNGNTRYDQWFDSELNNARLASIGSYHSMVPVFQIILSQSKGDLPTFYEKVAELAALKKTERDRLLNKILTTQYRLK